MQALAARQRRRGGVPASDSMTDEEEVISIDREDVRVLVLYGRAMLAAQLLEFSVFQLTHLERKSPKDMERAMRQIDGLLKQPSRDAAKGLARLPEHIRADLLEAFELRNRLAHQFLLEYRLQKAASESALSWATTILKGAIVVFDDLYRALDVETEAVLAEQGVEELTPDDEEAIGGSLRRWGEFPPELVDP